MLVKDILYEDFINYKKPSMFIIFPNCTFKCEDDCGVRCCQNSGLAHQQNIEVNIENIVQKYLENPITSAIICGGLEPFDSWDDLLYLVSYTRKFVEDDIVIYTGYYPKEINDYIICLQDYKNIIVKFGRYIPDREERYDRTLGVKLSSNNQYAIKLNT